MSRLGLARTLVLLLAALALPAAAHDDGLPPAQEAVRQQHLDAARAALSRGEPDAALVPLESAAGMSHAADTELLQLQMLLQRGSVRQALAFGAHAAAAHRDEPAARELLMWLLAISGQADYVRRQLDPAADAGLARLLSGIDNPGTPLPGTPPSPWPHGVAVPAASRPVATGLLIDDGRHALVPSEAVDGVATLWLRNGLGRASRARLAPTDPELARQGLALLDVDPPLPGPAGPAASGLVRAPGPAFAGSPAWRLAMLREDRAAPAWPLLQAGFLGRHRLGWPAGAALSGGPVFDRMGRLIGLALPGADGQERLLPAAEVPPLRALAAVSDAPPRNPEELYEAALPHVAQLLR